MDDDESGEYVETPRELFFIDYSDSNIRRVTLPGGGTSSVVADLPDKSGVGIAYNPNDGKIYWSDFEVANEGKIWRMNEDGSDMEELVTGLEEPYAVALNPETGKMYWADANKVSMANLDGSDLVTDFIVIDGQGSDRGSEGSLMTKRMIKFIFTRSMKGWYILQILTVEM